MSAFVESATALMSNAARRLDVLAHNVANISTPGYKRRVLFNDIVDTLAVSHRNMPVVDDNRSMAQGKIERTDNPFDMAIDGVGLFMVRDGDAMLYTRQGEFSRNRDGLLVTPQGYVLQQAGGGDIQIDGDGSVASDGTMIVDGRPMGRVAIMRPVDGADLDDVGESFFVAPAAAMMDEAVDATVRTGMLETSNVDLSEEMTQTMFALRQAESGARLIQVYDDLMGRVVSAFGSAGGR